MTMTCDQFRILAMGAVDAKPPGLRLALVEHSRACPHCDEFLAAAKRPVPRAEAERICRLVLRDQGIPVTAAQVAKLVDGMAAQGWVKEE